MLNIIKTQQTQIAALTKQLQEGWMGNRNHNTMVAVP